MMVIALDSALLPSQRFRGLFPFDGSIFHWYLVEEYPSEKALFYTVWVMITFWNFPVHCCTVEPLYHALYCTVPDLLPAAHRSTMGVSPRGERAGLVLAMASIANGSTHPSLNRPVTVLALFWFRVIVVVFAFFVFLF